MLPPIEQAYAASGGGKPNCGLAALWAVKIVSSGRRQPSEKRKRGIRYQHTRPMEASIRGGMKRTGLRKPTTSQCAGARQLDPVLLSAAAKSNATTAPAPNPEKTPDVDRTNLAYAALAMSRDLGFSDHVFGLGTGVFFVSYLALQIPGALIVELWSTRSMISATVIAWGSLTMLTALVQTPSQLYLPVTLPVFGNGSHSRMCIKVNSTYNRPRGTVT